MKRAIVIPCQTTGLSVIRSLGRKGFQIIGLSYAKTDFAQTSKYVHESLKIPHPREEEKEFIHFLVNNSYRWKGALIFDTDDEVTVSLSKNRAKLAEHYKLVADEWDVIRKFIEKPETYKLAERCGVPYPKTFLANTLHELHSIKDEIVYPSILKPVLSHEFVGRFRTKGFRVSNYGELLPKFELCLESGQQVMIQEIIPGPDSNIHTCMVYVNSKGKINAKFFRRKIRQNPPQFGVTRVGISQDRIPEIDEYTQKILEEANYRGIAGSTFKHDPRDNQFKLLEINVRTERPSFLATECGVNFPWIAYMDLVERKQVEVNDYKKDVYWIEIYQDVRNSILHYGKENLGWRDYIKPYVSRNKTFAVLSSDDFVPFLRQLFNLPVIFPSKAYGFLKAAYSK